MTWLMSTELLPVVGVLALVIAWPRPHASTSIQRLCAEVFAIGILTIAACAGLWALYWFAEQRW